MRESRYRSAALVLLVIALVGALVVLAVRVATWLPCWRWTSTEGAEGPQPYAIWRLLNDHPLYESPTSEPYSLTFYNFAFYYLQAWLAGPLIRRSEDLMWACRLVTVLGALLGTVTFAGLARRLAPPRSTLEGAALWSLAIVVWFGTQFSAWWPLSIRPDIWAAFLALVGLSVALKALESEKAATFVLASLCFFSAWCFKQSAVQLFGGTVLATLVIQRRAAPVLALVVPFALLAGAALIVGGHEYRTNLLVAPALSAWHARPVVEIFGRVLLQNAWIWGMFPLAMALTWRRHGRAGLLALPVVDRALAIIAAVSLAMGLISLGREGSNKNHLLEAYLVLALAGWRALIAGPLGAGAGVLPKLAVALGLPLVVFPWVQLALPNRVGRVVLCTDTDVSELQRLAQSIQRLPKPIYIEHDVFSQPWLASNDRYPALVGDLAWQAIARRRGALVPDFPVNLFKEGRFRAVVLIAGDSRRTALESLRWTCSSVDGASAFVACTNAAASGS